MKGIEHIAELLPAYLNGTLSTHDDRRVREHLQSCAGCRAELASWEAIRDATVASSYRLPEPPERVMEKVREKIHWDEEETVVASSSLDSRFSLMRQLIKGQVPLVRRAVWVASAVTMSLGCLVALFAANPTSAGMTLAVFAPVIAAVGVAFIYGPESDPSLEIALSTPTPPRLVLLARLTLVYSYDLALALIATAVLTLAKGGVDPWPLISLWIGPMLFLSALALLLSLLVSANFAAFVTISLWAAKLVAVSYAGKILVPVWMANLVDAFWQTNPILLPLAVLLFAAVLLYIPRYERLV